MWEVALELGRCAWPTRICHWVATVSPKGLTKTFHKLLSYEAVKIDTARDQKITPSSV
jgi:hypothetical protein